MDGIIKLAPEVEEATRRIKAGWSERERNKRLQGPKPATKWLVPIASVADMEAAQRENDNS